MECAAFVCVLLSGDKHPLRLVGHGHRGLERRRRFWREGTGDGGKNILREVWDLGSTAARADDPAF